MKTKKTKNQNSKLKTKSKTKLKRAHRAKPCRDLRAAGDLCPPGGSSGTPHTPPGGGHDARPPPPPSSSSLSNHPLVAHFSQAARQFVRVAAARFLAVSLTPGEILPYCCFFVRSFFFTLRRVLFFILAHPFFNAEIFYFVPHCVVSLVPRHIPPARPVWLSPTNRTSFTAVMKGCLLSGNPTFRWRLGTSSTSYCAL